MALRLNRTDVCNSLWLGSIYSRILPHCSVAAGCINLVGIVTALQPQNVEWHTSQTTWNEIHLSKYTKFKHDIATFHKVLLAGAVVLIAQSGDMPLQTAELTKHPSHPPEFPVVPLLLWNTVNRLLDLSKWQELLVIALCNINHQLLGAFWEFSREEPWKTKKSMNASVLLGSNEPEEFYSASPLVFMLYILQSKQQPMGLCRDTALI